MPLAQSLSQFGFWYGGGAGGTFFPHGASPGGGPFNVAHAGYTAVVRYSYGLVFAVPGGKPVGGFAMSEAHSIASFGASKEVSKFTEMVTRVAPFAAFGFASRPVNEPLSSL